MTIKITIHDFVVVEDAPPASTPVRLEQGRDLAFACLASDDRWVTPQQTTDPSVFTLRRDKLYQYRFSPPSSTTGKTSLNILEWGQQSHADDPDWFRLRDLQEFESTDFQPSMYSRIGVVNPSRHGKRMQGDGANIGKPEKRLLLGTSSISRLVSQPHFIPAPTAKFRPIDTSKIPPYQKASPSPIAPFDAAKVDQLLNCRYRRVAWVVPARGSLPWNGTSNAVILEDTWVASRSPGPCLHVPAPQPHVITWTPDSLQHFWTFLGSIQQAKHLGPLSLSFHAAHTDMLLPTDGFSEPVWESNHPYYHQLSSKGSGVSPDDFAMEIWSHLEHIDYFKVFHDVPYSLSLRNILDAYRYEPVSGEVPGRSGANDRKIRILKGAHLVLMDEHSKAVFWM